jgi:hypothetical protein
MALENLESVEQRLEPNLFDRLGAGRHRFVSQMTAVSLTRQRD